MNTQGLVVLGSTGTIGVNTLDLVSKSRDKFNIIALVANTSVDKLYEQCLSFNPKFAIMADPPAAKLLEQRLQEVNSKVEVLSGALPILDIVSHPDVDTIMAAMVGSCGLMPVIKALEASKKVLLANKESLVMAGHWVMKACVDNNATIIPIDSEHNAIFQLLGDDYKVGFTPDHIKEITITASGGPFLYKPLEEFDSITPSEAVRHPNWSMGAKISVDSSTMINKCLEIIEAFWLFALAPETIKTVIHPQSIVHAMITYTDGSQLAQLNKPDMRVPIAHGLFYPYRAITNLPRIDLTAMPQLEFLAPCHERFACLKLLPAVLNQAKELACIMNAANEELVAAFLSNNLKYRQITYLLQDVMDKFVAPNCNTLDDILNLNHEVRIYTTGLINK